MHNVTRSEVEKKLATEGFPFKDCLSPVLVPLLEEMRTDVRSRIYPTECVVFCEISAILSGDSTLSGAVIRNNQDRIQSGLEPASANTAAYAKARQKVPVELFAQAACELARATSASLPQQEDWMGMHPFGVDGSTLTASDTKANQKAFPQHGQQEDGTGFPLVRFVLLQSLGTGMVHDVAFGPFKGKQTGEMALARKILASLPENALLLGDCYFPSFFMMAQLIERKIQGLFPIHFARDIDFRRGEQLHYRDHIIEWIKPSKPTWMTKSEYETFPESISLREVDLTRDTKQKEPFVVVTTLLDAQKFPRKTLAKFYKKRWKIELALRDLKTTFKMEHLRGQTPDMVARNLWSYMLAYNVLRWHMLNASLLFNKPIDEISVKNAGRVLTEATHHIQELKKASAPFFSPDSTMQSA